MSPEVTVEALAAHVAEPLALEFCAGRGGSGRLLRSSRIQKPGLALAGYSAFVHADRVQVLGQTEISYLSTLNAEGRRHAAKTLCALEPACVLVTKGLSIPDELRDECERTQTALMRTPIASSDAIRQLSAYLDDLLTPRTSVHGVMVDVDGVGCLISGASGVGKSECALDLVLRGHRLVADDVVDIRRRGEDLVGQAAELIRNLIEIRGLGILNVAELYGVSSTRDHKRIELHIELEAWRNDGEYDRLGFDDRSHEILGVKLSSVLIPVRPGRNIAGIVEVAARNALLKARGHHAAAALEQRIDRDLASQERRVHRALREAALLSPLRDHIEDEIE